jgi:hypothetical protein
MIKGLTITEFAPNDIGRAIGSIWDRILQQAAPTQLLRTAAGG